MAKGDYLAVRKLVLEGQGAADSEDFVAAFTFAREAADRVEGFDAEAGHRLATVSRRASAALDADPKRAWAVLDFALRDELDGRGRA